MSTVSIAIPVYNALPYLPELRESLETQTLSAKEIVLVDDGSTDGSLEYLQEWCAQSERCTLLEGDHGGPSEARNRALDYLAQQTERPDYLVFLDSDDKLRTDALEVLTMQADAEDLDVLEFAAFAFFENTTLQIRLGHYESYYLREVPIDGVLSGPAYAALLARNGLFLPSPCLHFVRTNLLLDNGIRFYPGIIHEDNLYTFMCLLHAQRVSYSPEPLYLRRIRENSIMSTPTSWKNALGYFRCAQEAVKLLDGRTDLAADEAAGFKTIASDFYGGAIGACEKLSEAEIAEGVAELPMGEQVLFQKLVLEPMRDRAERQRLERKLADTVRQFEESPSFRIGRTITAVPRKILGR